MVFKEDSESCWPSSISRIAWYCPANSTFKRNPLGRFGYHVDDSQKPTLTRTFTLCKNLGGTALTFYQGRAKLEDFLAYAKANRKSANCHH